MHEHLKDGAHIEYDLAIRRLAETEGFAAFGNEHNGLSVTYYGVQNMRPKVSSKTIGSSRKAIEFIKDGKKACFRWNTEYGRIRAEDECGYGHWCAKCGRKAITK